MMEGQQHRSFRGTKNLRAGKTYRRQSQMEKAKQAFQDYERDAKALSSLQGFMGEDGEK